MKIHQRFAVAMSMVLVLGVLPNRLFAQSESRISKVVTVGENTLLTGENQSTTGPMLVIALKDDLNGGDRFYLNLENARWLKAIKIEGIDGVKVQSQVLDPQELEVSMEEGTVPAGTTLTIPMVVDVSRGEASVTIESNNTAVTSERLVFARTSVQKGQVKGGQVAKVLEKGTMATVMIEEGYAGQFAKGISSGESNQMSINLEQDGYGWVLDDEDEIEPKLVGTKGYEGISLGKEAFEVVGEQQLKVNLPESVKERTDLGRGGFKIEGIGIKAIDSEAFKGMVTGHVEGDLIEAQSIALLEVAEYSVNLVPKEIYEPFEGSQMEIGFRLEENMAGALLKDRSLDMVFTGGVTLPLNDKGKVDVMIGEKAYQFPPIEVKNKCVGFEITNLLEPELKNQLAYDFKVKVELPLRMKQEVGLMVEGRGLPETLEVQVMKVQPRVTSRFEAFQVSSGKREQVGGRITLAESSAGAIMACESILLNLDHEGIELTKLPVVEVIEGDLKLGEPEKVPEGIKIPVERKSTKPSKVEIKHLELSVSGVVADGYYPISIEGKALSQIAVDKIVEEDFIRVNVGPKDIRKITFKLGEEAYAVNGKYYHLDVPATMVNGRTMVPLKYVTEALGLADEKVKWNKETDEITLYGNKTIELEIDSNIMKVDGEKIYMAVPTSLVNGRTMVPIGEIARALELDVTWDSKLETATFVSKGNR